MIERDRKPEDMVQLKLRLREDLRQALEKGAKEENRSLNREIVSRLEESIRASRQIEEILGGAHNAVLLRFLAGEIGLVELKTGHPWHKDTGTLLQVASAVVDTMNQLVSEHEELGRPADELKRLRDKLSARNRRFRELRSAGSK